jgi:hypothetical protein
MTDRVWSDFAGQCWRQRPAVVRDAVARPMLTPHELLVLLQHIGAQAVDGHPLVIRCYVDGAEVNGARRVPFLATSDDASFEAYADRVTATLGGRRFGVILNQATSHSTVLWRRARSFLQRVYGVIGIPCGVSECGIFFGTYDETPFGIHSDEADVFVFSIERTKRMLLWPRSYFEHRNVPIVPTVLGEEVLGELESFAPDAIDLRSTPTDVMYWPRDYWHVGVNSGEEGLHASLSLGAYMSRGEPMLVGDLKALLFSSMTREPPSGMTLSPEAPSACLREVVAYVDETCAALRAAAAADSMQRKLLGRWLASLSGSGLPPPPRGEVLLEESCEISVTAESLILEHQAPGGGMIVAANGRYVHVSDEEARATRTMLARVHAREPFAVSRATDMATRSLVQWLLGTHALEVRAEQSSPFGSAND